MVCSSPGMQLSHALTGYAEVIPASGAEKRSPVLAKPVEHKHSKYAGDEINAYIAIRDNLLTEAEETPTAATVHRAWIANDVVETFLKPARPPYGAQHLPEIDAARERERCETVKAHIRDLSAPVALAASQCAAA
jgi:hypothetical protein